MDKHDSVESSDEQTDMDPRQFYNEFGKDEWERLERDPVGRFEFDHTINILDEYLPKSGRILDAGGGPGRYSVWLAKQGYTVNHLDLSEAQVSLAKEKVRDHGVHQQVSCKQGDIRNLPYENQEFDAVCCLGGPLSHIVAEKDRERAIRELNRVVKPQGFVFISVIGRLTAVMDGIRHQLDTHPGILPELVSTGDYTADLLEEYEDEGWAECHFFRADELREDLESEGLVVKKLVGLEGPASIMKPELATASDEAVESVKETVWMLREDPSVVDLSAHILAVCE